MSGCLGSLCGCMSSFLMGAIRFLLILICSLIFISQVIAVWALYNIENEVMDEFTPGFRVHCSSYLTAIFIALVGLIGAHGAYTKNPAYLKAFALASMFIALGAILSHVLHSDDNKEAWEKNRKLFTANMEEYADHYQFDAKPGQVVNKETKAWDMLQKGMGCCGLRGPKDWLNWKTSSKNVLPHSCCPYLSRAAKRDDGPFAEPTECHLKQAMDTGCLERIDMVYEFSQKRSIIIAVFYSILALWALLIARESQAEASSVARSPNGPTTHYQRFDGSVYVRQPVAVPNQQLNYTKQPAVAPGYQDQSSFYPTLSAYGAERGAPPKYS